MRKVFIGAAAIVTVLAAVTSVLTWANRTKKEIVGLTPEQVRWFTPAYYKDGRQRAQLFGESSQGGAWVDRAKIASGMRVLAPTHPLEASVTVLAGSWC